MSAFTEDDRAQLRLSVERLASEQFAFEKRSDAQRSASKPWRTAWQAIADAGWLALPVPVEQGGLGGGAAELAIIMEAAGRSLIAAPILSSAVICTRLIAQLGSEPQKAMLQDLAAGRMVAAFAHGEPRQGYGEATIETEAVLAADGYRLSGAKCAVLDGELADVLLVSAVEAEGGWGVFLVRRDAPGLRVTAYMTVDERTAADVELQGAPAERLGGRDARAQVEAALDLARVAIGYEAAGAMARLVELTTSYLQERRQFGRPLAEFQVLRHRLVDMFIALEESRAMLDDAREALAGEAAKRTRAVAAAKVLYARAATYVGQQAVQLHGGMGMTDELPVSHYFRRLTLLATLFGDAETSLERFSEAA